MHLAVCIPVFDDWPAVEQLLPGLNTAATKLGARLTIVLVDDGSSVRPDSERLRRASGARVQAVILELRRNVGHQRAICIGLCHIHDSIECDGVVVMDGDGEDTPSGFEKLVGSWKDSSRDRVVFARRGRRQESLVFRSGYGLFRLLHRILVGNETSIGNFSLIPAARLDALVVTDDLWNHYAAAVIRLGVPTQHITISRGKRTAGRSRMNLTSLVIHGLSAISVYGDVVGVRLLLAATGLALMSALAAIMVVAIRLFTNLAVAGWATYSVGILAVIGLQSLLSAVLLSFFLLSSRSAAQRAPINFYETFVSTTSSVQSGSAS